MIRADDNLDSSGSSWTDGLNKALDFGTRIKTLISGDPAPAPNAPNAPQNQSTSPAWLVPVAIVAGVLIVGALLVSFFRGR